MSGFLREMLSEEWQQKLYTDDASPARSGEYFWLVYANFPRWNTRESEIASHYISTYLASTPRHLQAPKQKAYQNISQSETMQAVKKQINFFHQLFLEENNPW